MTILLLLVHKILFLQIKYTNKFDTSAIPDRCQIIAIMLFQQGHMITDITLMMQEFEANCTRML